MGKKNFSLKELLQLDTFKVITNVVQREGGGGKPAIFVNEEKNFVTELCPEPIIVPVGVECVWVLVTPRQANLKSRIHHIAVASVYYSGPKNAGKNAYYDHIAETYHFLLSKYGSRLHFLICGNTNRLNLGPILSLSVQIRGMVNSQII